MIYLDFAATTPISDTSLQVYNKVAKDYYGNASSLHDIGSSAKQVLDASRKTIASILNSEPDHIHFTSGGSESNFIAIHSLVGGAQNKGKHLITTEIEHSSVRNVFKQLEEQGYEVTWLGVDALGNINLDELKSEIREDTILASIQHGNSEIGTMQDIFTIGSILRDAKVLFHSDCVQTFAKQEINLDELQIDAITFSSHKVYGPKGVGGAWMNPKSNWKSMIPNISHEGGFVQGTSNVAGIAAFAAAAKEFYTEKDQINEHFLNLRQHVLGALNYLEHDIQIQGNAIYVLPNIIGLRVPGIEGQFLMLEASQAGIAIATGSACTSGSQEPSRTMAAIYESEQDAREFVRLSLGKMTKREELDKAIEKIDAILSRHFSKVKI